MTKVRSALKHAPLALVIIVSFGFISFALAQDVVETTGAAAIGADVEASGGLVRPLDLIRRAKEAQQAINQGAMDANVELRAETKMQMEGAETPEERQAIMQNAADGRMQIARDRMEATTDLRASLRTRVITHIGLIRERFSNVITHLEKFMTRIDARIAKLEAAGADVSGLAELRADAAAAIEQAKTDIAAVRAYVDSVTDDTNRDSAKTELRTLIDTARKSIAAAHASVRTLIQSLVGVAQTVRPDVETSAGADADASVDAGTDTDTQ